MLPLFLNSPPTVPFLPSLCPHYPYISPPLMPIPVPILCCSLLACFRSIMGAPNLFKETPPTQLPPNSTFPPPVSWDLLTSPLSGSHCSTITLMSLKPPVLQFIQLILKKLFFKISFMLPDAHNNAFHVAKAVKECQCGIVNRMTD